MSGEHINSSIDPTTGELLRSGDATDEVDITLREPVGKFLHSKPRVKIMIILLDPGLLGSSHR